MGPLAQRRKGADRVCGPLARAKVRSVLVALSCLLLAHPMTAVGQCQRAKLVDAQGQAGDKFGFSSAVDGDRVVIGVPWDDDRGNNFGSAFVFERSAGGAVWAEVAKLPSPDSDILAGFGWSLALEGETALISARGPQAAYIFEGAAEEWCETAELVPADQWFGDFYGECLSLSGDVAVITAPHDNDNGAESGSAYVFARDPNGVWTETAKLLASDGYGGDHFGAAVAISGDVIVIGAPDDDDLGFVSGSAYVFERQANGTWSQVAKLLASDGGTAHRFGISVAVDGRVILVGAQDAHGNEIYTGAAYIFQRDVLPGWYQRQKLTASDGETSDFFGRSVALSADIAVIGAHGDDEAGHNAGAAYVFVCNAGGTWLQVGKLTAEDGGEDDRLGYAVALSGNVAVVGAYLDDDNGEDSGSAYVFAVGPDEDGDGIMDVCLCPGDLDGDYDVDLADLAQLLPNYGTTSGAEYEDGDLDGDGDVDLTDLAALLAVYGTTCP